MDKNRLDILVVNPDGSVSIREVFIIVFYLARPNLDIVQSVERAIRGFVELVSLDALSDYYNYDGEQEELTAQSLDEIITERLLGPNREANANIELSGRGIYAPEYYLWYNGKALDIEEAREEVGYLWSWMPRNFYLNNTVKTINYISSLALDLPFTFAYSSLGLAGENKYVKQGLAIRHPGLDIAHPGCVSADLGLRAAGSYWMNLLGPELCALVGGVTALRAELPGEILVDELPGGKCQILLGPEPGIGDINRRDLLPLNQSLARFFRRKGVLHVPERVVYFVDQQGMADREGMEEWHQRFID